MPGSARKVWAWLGEKKRPEEVLFRDLEFVGLEPGRRVGEPTPLFPRVALKDFLAAMAEPAPETAKEDSMEQVGYEEFKKMDLRVALVLKAERVPNTDKLLKLEVDVGSETRTLVAGVGDVYSPEDLAGKRLAVIVNLKPAVIRGVESRGMILAAEWQGKAKIAFYDDDVPAGSRIK